MKLKETHLRATIRNILLSELFVSPRNRKKPSVLKRALDTRNTAGFYSDDPYDGFGKFDEAEEDLEEDLEEDGDIN